MNKFNEQPCGSYFDTDDQVLENYLFEDSCLDHNKFKEMYLGGWETSSPSLEEIDNWIKLMESEELSYYTKVVSI